MGMKWKLAAAFLALISLAEAVALTIVLKTYQKRPEPLSAKFLKADGMCRAWGREWRPSNGQCRMENFPYHQRPNLQLYRK